MVVMIIILATGGIPGGGRGLSADGGFSPAAVRQHQHTSSLTQLVFSFL